MGSSGAYTVCLLKALAHGRAHVEHPGRSPRRRATSRSTCSGSRRASRTSTSPRTAASAPTRSTPTARSTSSRWSSARRTLRAHARQLPALLHRRDARSASTSCSRPGRAHQGRDTEMVANLHRTKEIGHREPRACWRRATSRRYARADARALAQQARALAGHGRPSGSTRSTTLARAGGASAASWSGRAAAASCSSTPSGPTHAPGDGRGGRPGGALRLRVPGLLRAGVRLTLRVGIVGCGLIGRKRAAALRAGPAGRLLRRRSRARPRARRRLPARVAVRRRSTRCWRSSPDVVIVADDATTRWPSVAVARSRPGRTCWSRSPPGVTRRRGRRASPRPRERPGRLVKVGFNHRFHPGIAPRDRRGALRRPRRRDVHARPLRPRRAARLRPRVARRPGASPAAARCSTRACTCSTSATGCSGPLPLHSALLRTQLLGHAGRGQRRADPAASAGPARRPGRCIHVSWTEWKNEFALEIYCRTAKLAVDGPRALLRPADAAHLPDAARDGAARRPRRSSTRPRTARGRRVGALLRARSPTAQPLLGGLQDARYAWEIARARLCRRPATTRSARASG